MARNADQNSSPQVFHHGRGYLTRYYLLNKESHKSKCLLNILVGAVGVCMWRLENNLESLSLGVVHLRETGSFIGQLDQAGWPVSPR